MATLSALAQYNGLAVHGRRPPFLAGHFVCVCGSQYSLGLPTSGTF